MAVQMDPPLATNNPKQVASEMNAEIRALPVRNTPNTRAIRRKYSRMLEQAGPEFVLDVARTLVEDYGYRGPAYELAANHRAAFERIGEPEVEEFGQGINSWWSVDSFARTLAGPAWLRGQVSDALIDRWAHSEDRWWRRAALVSTVALNVRSHGGRGDVGRTLGVCRLLVRDHDDMVVKAMSWALRELVMHDADAVGEFLREHGDVLAARVKREVRNKLTTGLKSPGQKRD
jgi:3-methyladenine DNA glycosylase AlkD